VILGHRGHGRRGHLSGAGHEGAGPPGRLELSDAATAELVVACGFELATLRVATWRVMPPIVRPLVIGRAQPRTNETAQTGPPVDHALSMTAPGAAR
jgi:hypothetical protein